MKFETAPPFLAHMMRSSHFTAAGQHAAFYRAVRSGTLVRIAAGMYLPSVVWSALDPDERYLARVHAAAGVAGATRLHSHFAAAALWRLPTVGRWPAKSHALAERGSGGFSRASHVMHTASIPSTTDEIDGLHTTTLARTLVDVARVAPMSVAVAMTDRALAPKSADARSVFAERVTHAALSAEVDFDDARSGSRKCELALNFADGLSGSAGESVSRVAIHVLGFPAPELQRKFVDEEGEMFADFWWPEFNLVGEFDGLGKYVKLELLAGKTTAQAVVAEKRREDRIRALGPSVTRWDWPVARSLPLLEARLLRAGLRKV